MHRATSAIPAPAIAHGDTWLEAWNTDVGAWIPVEKHSDVDKATYAMQHAGVPHRQLRVVRVTGVGPEPRRIVDGTEHRASRA